MSSGRDVQLTEDQERRLVAAVTADERVPNRVLVKRFNIHKGTLLTVMRKHGWKAVGTQMWVKE